VRRAGSGAIAPEGFVSLVGAGPGDPELLTRRAADRLASADLVLYDALVPKETLELAPGARRFYVGKRPRRHSLAQETIHALMIRAARRGRRVVRLKGGDPFVFGRGGEEALALAEAGVPFEVVPGVSAATAAPGLAGIPVTHRGLSTAVVVVSGHAEEAYRPVLESLAPGCATLVVLMGMSARSRIAALLRRRGWSDSTPMAILVAASTPGAWQWSGSLAELGTVALPRELGDAPGTLVVGRVVELPAQVRALAESASGVATG
jgi:uroporphyrin-III C-methyltransferase